MKSLAPAGAPSPSALTPSSPASSSASSSGPTTTTYTIPTIKGDPHAVYRLADAYRALADDLAATASQVGQVAAGVSGSWRGQAERALDRPVQAFLRHAFVLCRALREAADELDAYGHQLAKAQHHHRWSLGKILKVGAVVAVSATAIVVTVGAAGVIEAGAAAAAVGATEAAGAATAADVAVAGSLEASLGDMLAIRPLLAFVVPHLVQAEWAAGGTAAYEEATADRLRWRAVGEAAGTAFVASGAASKASQAVGDSSWLPHLAQGGTWAGAAAADDELAERRISLSDVAESFVLAGGSTAARDALRERGLWLEPPDYRRQALVALLHQPGRVPDAEIAHELALLRQPVDELTDGDLDLLLHEGPGHTIDRHVAKTAPELLQRVRTTRRLQVASTYWDRATAHDAIEQTLRANEAEIKRWMGVGSPRTLSLRLKVPYDLGFAVDRSGTVRFVRQAAVVLRRDPAGVVVVTSYPLGRR